MSLGQETETRTLLGQGEEGPSAPPKLSPPPSTRKNFLYGLLCITSVAVIWVAAGELAQYVFLSLHINEPVFLTYINVSEFMVLLPVAYLREGVWGVSPHSIQYILILLIRFMHQIFYFGYGQCIH